MAELSLDAYQQQARSTAVYSEGIEKASTPSWIYLGLGLCGEVGEVADVLEQAAEDTLVGDVLRMCALVGSIAEQLKKAIRDDGGVLTGTRRGLIGAALGELYVACEDFGDAFDGKVGRRLAPPADAKIDVETDRLLHKEQGDVLWYQSQLALARGTLLSSIAQSNLDKLAERKSKGKLHGSGGDR